MRKSMIIVLSGTLLAGAAVADVGAPPFVYLQSSDMLTSNVVGLDVYDPTGHDIAKIKDVAFNDAKAIQGYVLSVGGFLGAGSHYVAVDAGSVKIDYDANAKKWRASMATTADQLKAAPAFEYQGKWDASKS